MTRQQKIAKLDHAIEILLNRQRELERELMYEKQNNTQNQATIDRLQTQVDRLLDQIAQKENERAGI